MKKKFKRGVRKKNSGNLNRLNLFQVPKFQFKKKCPLTGKNAPEIDYKNIKLLKKYISENGKILPSRVTSVSQRKQRKLTQSIKRARILALI
jgi:small subunit ribosomal protein S18